MEQIAWKNNARRKKGILRERCLRHAWGHTLRNLQAKDNLSWTWLWNIWYGFHQHNGTKKFDMEQLMEYGLKKLDVEQILEIEYIRLELD